jgi:DNA repair exonuclease SbcCD ATPase subunit
LIQIQQVELRNWRRVKSASVVFPKVGTIAMMGSNGVSGKSVGAGKTSLGEAVSKAVFGVPTKALGKMSFRRKGDTYVKVEGSLDGKPFTIEAGYKCKELGGTGEGLRFTVNGVTVQRADCKDTRNELNSVLGISSELAAWTVFMNGDKLDFSELTQVAQVELLMQALQQPPWPSYSQGARKALEKKVSLEVSARSDLDAVNRSLISSENAVALSQEEVATEEKRYAAISEQYTKVQAVFEAKMKELETAYQKAAAVQKIARQELSSVMESAEQQAEAEFKTAKDKAQKDYGDSQVVARKAATKRATDNAEWQRLRREYEKFAKRPKTCPTCGQKWPDDEHLEAEKQKAQTALAKAEDAFQASEAALEKAESRESELDNALHAILNRMATRQKELTRAASDKVVAVDALADRAARSADAWESTTPQKPNADALNAARAQLDAERRMVTRLKEQVVEAGAALARAERQVMLHKYWVEALGPTGIPNLIINQALPPLNSAAQAASLSLTGGEIDVTFGTTRELATGEERNKLTVYVDNPKGADELGEFSKGEGGLTNLIISESLSLIGQMPRRCSWRWLDEVINNQDRRHVYSYYKRLAHANNMAIFIVDHHPDALSLADHVLVATKDEQGFTSYAWER